MKPALTWCIFIRISLIKWYWITFLLGMVEGAIGTFFPIIVIHKGGSLLLLGILTGLVSLGGVFQLLWIEIIEGKKKPKKVAVGAQLSNLVAFGVMATSSHPIYYGAGRIINGINNSAYTNADNYSRYAYSSKQQRGRVGSTFMAINMVGICFAVLITGFVYETHGYNSSWLIHLVAAIFIIMALIFYKLSIPEFDRTQILDDDLAREINQNKLVPNYNTREKFQLAKLSNGLFSFVISLTLFNFGVAISGPFFVIDLENRWDLSNINIATLMAFNVFIQMMIIFVLIPAVDRINRKKLFSIGVALSNFHAIALCLNPSLVSTLIQSMFRFWIIIFFMSSIGWGIIHALFITLMIDYCDPKIRGTIIGVFGAIQAVFIFLGSFLGGLLLRYFFTNIAMIFLVSLIFRGLGMLYLAFTSSPPIPFSDFLSKRRVFMARIGSSLERGLMMLPFSRSFKKKK